MPATPRGTTGSGSGSAGWSTRRSRSRPTTRVSARSSATGSRRMPAPPGPRSGRRRSAGPPDDRGTLDCRGMDQRVSLVTLGVRDLGRARSFYEALGWRSGAAPDDDIVFFQAGGMILALWSRVLLEEDTAVEDGGGWGGVTLAYTVRAPEDVDAVVEEARRAGARIAREPATTFWGGYSAVFVDPEGHPWEVAHNPHWTMHDDGSVSLGG